MKLNKILGLTAATLSIAALAACAPGGSSSEKGGSDSETIKVGIMTRDEYTTAVWDKITELAAKDGVTVELTEFTDYSQPNKAVAEGDVDVNAFQHIAFLEDWNKENGGDLQVAGYTIYSPIRLYSGVKDGKDTYTDVKDIPEGAEITIPNDETNRGRALLVLQAAGLIELDFAAGEFATPADITKNAKNLTITELDASQTARSLESVDAAVINNNYAQEAGLDTSKAIFIEPASDDIKVFYNVIAAPKGFEKSDKAKAIETLIKAYNNDEVAEIIKSTSKTDLPIWNEAK